MDQLWLLEVFCLRTGLPLMVLGECQQARLRHMCTAAKTRQRRVVVEQQREAAVL